MPGAFRVGVDIGGTFTDIVLLDAGGRIHTKKVSSSVDDYARAIVDGLGEVFRETGLAGGDFAEVLHGTTVASNAILELKEAIARDPNNPALRRLLASSYKQKVDLLKRVGG